MQLFAKSDTGEVRSSNQDFYAIGQTEEYAFAIVCDGMGGHNGGNVASEMAVEIIKTHLTEKLTGTLFDKVVEFAIKEGIERANKVIYEKSKVDEKLFGMGTTAVVAVFADNKMYIAHVGDSRAYSIKDGHFSQLTRDHSVVQELIECGKITQTEAREHPKKNIITRAIGVEKSVDADMLSYVPEQKEILLICTDGLSNYLTDEVFSKLIQGGRREEYVEQFVSYAKQSGGADNITVAIMIND